METCDNIQFHSAGAEVQVDGKYIGNGQYYEGGTYNIKCCNDRSWLIGNDDSNSCVGHVQAQTTECDRPSLTSPTTVWKHYHNAIRKWTNFSPNIICLGNYLMCEI